ncbi:MAG: hypothetical protein ACRBFS_24445 [Aureispira sp.]
MNKKIVLASGVLALWWLTQKEEPATNPTPTGGTTNTGGGTNTGGTTVSPCQGKEYLVNGKKVCETVLSDMGFVWIKHPTIPDGFYHYTDILNSERLSNADFLTWVKKGVDILQGPYHPNYTVYYTKMFNQGFKGTAPLQVANP